MTEEDITLIEGDDPPPDIDPDPVDEDTDTDQDTGDMDLDPVHFVGDETDTKGKDV